MKGRFANKAVLIGAGAGLVLFAIFGLLQGSFLGGVMGLNIAGSLLGYPVKSGLLARLIVAASMLVGVLVAGIIFVMGGGLAGWLVGALADFFSAPKGVGEKETKR